MDILLTFSLSSAVFAALCMLLIAIITLGAYRVYFSPYARFPGPVLAGLTGAYAFYYDVIKDGQYMFKIEELHKTYRSPVIRISPYGIHVNDPVFYDTIFVGAQGKRDKPPMYKKLSGVPDSMVTLISHDAHRQRRSLYSLYFSTKYIRKLEPIICERLSTLLRTFDRHQKNKVPIPMKSAFGAMSCDIITQYCFGTHENYTEAPGFNCVVLDTIDAAVANFHILEHMPWLFSMVSYVPEWLVKKLIGPGKLKLDQMKYHCIEKINEVIDSLDDFHSPGSEQKTIFRDFLDRSIRLGVPKDDAVSQAWQDAQIMLSAGTVTLSTAISSNLVYLMLDPPRLLNLMLELEHAIPDPTEVKHFAELEQLPYLTAVIRETHRLTSEVSARLARSAPSESLKLGKWTIPPKTNIYVHQPLIHLSPKFYPHPWSWIPERWITGSAAELYPRPDGIPLANTKYFMPFSRGTRNCIGQTLAQVELYFTIAIFLRTFARLEDDEHGDKVVRGIQLWETDRRDMNVKRDRLLAKPEKGRGNMRMVLS